MTEAAQSEELDGRRFANALFLVWEQLRGVESRCAGLNATLGVLKNVSPPLTPAPAAADPAPC